MAHGAACLARLSVGSPLLDLGAPHRRATLPTTLAAAPRRHPVVSPAGVALSGLLGRRALLPLGSASPYTSSMRLPSWWKYSADQIASGCGSAMKRSISSRALATSSPVIRSVSTVCNVVGVKG
jgi:hypothetical protein